MFTAANNLTLENIERRLRELDARAADLVATAAAPATAPPPVAGRRVDLRELDRDPARFADYLLHCEFPGCHDRFFKTRKQACHHFAFAHGGGSGSAIVRRALDDGTGGDRGALALIPRDQVPRELYAASARPYVCAQCDESYVARRMLRSHTRARHLE